MPVPTVTPIFFCSTTCFNSASYLVVYPLGRNTNGSIKYTQHGLFTSVYNMVSFFRQRSGVNRMIEKNVNQCQMLRVNGLSVSFFNTSGNEFLHCQRFTGAYRDY